MIGSIVKVLAPPHWRGSIGIIISPFSENKTGHGFSWIVKIKEDDVAFFDEELEIIKQRDLTMFI